MPKVTETALCVMALVPVALAAACGGFGGGGGGSSGGTTTLADLVVDHVAFDPAQASAGTSLSVSDTVSNSGARAADNVRIGIYLSADPSITTADRLLGFRMLARLDPGAASSGGGSLTLPASTTGGDYWIGAIVDDVAGIAESSENNNTASAALTVHVLPAVLPDLEVTSVGASPAAVLAGGPITISDTVANSGAVPAGAFQVAVYLSEDDQISTQDVLIGVRPVAGLAAGATSSGLDVLQVPATTTAGAHWIGVVADAQGEVVEIDELDNARTLSAPIQVSVPPRPNLVPQALTFTPASVDSGLSISVQDTLANVGPGAATQFEIGVYLSSDATVTREDVLLGTRALIGLASGASNSSGGEVLVPIETAGGTYHVGVIVDSLLDVPETSESDNVLVAATPLVVTVPPRPDLVPQVLSFTPATADTTLGTTITVTTSVANLGVVPATPFRVGLYLSANNVITTADVLLASRDVLGLAVGASSGAFTDVVVPSGVSAGTYFVGVIVDDQAAQLELSEANNALLAPGTLDVVASPVPMPDLVMQTVSMDTHTVVQGGVVQVLNEVRNQGTLSAGGFQVGIYLSTDDVIAIDDRRIGTRTVFQLGINFGSASSAPYLVPATITPATYFLGAIADDASQVAESQEANNGMRAPGTLVVSAPPIPMPDLIVTAGAFTPSNASPGQTLQLSATVRNQGDLAAGPFRIAFYVSTNATVDAQDVLLGFQTLDALAPNQVFVGTIGALLPAGLAPGSYTLGVFVDDAQSVIEGLETNNILIAATVLVVP